jgi:hypothetical protein
VHRKGEKDAHFNNLKNLLNGNNMNNNVANRNVESRG